MRSLAWLAQTSPPDAGPHFLTSHPSVLVAPPPTPPSAKLSSSLQERPLWSSPPHLPLRRVPRQALGASPSVVAVGPLAPLSVTPSSKSTPRAAAPQHQALTTTNMHGSDMVYLCHDRFLGSRGVNGIARQGLARLGHAARRRGRSTSSCSEEDCS